MSNNLSLSQVTASQNQKEVTINAQAAEIDAAITVKADFAINNTNARTLTTTELRRNFLFHITDDGTPPTGDITLTVPAISRGVFAVLNATSFNVTVTIFGQAVTAPVIAAGATTPSLLTVDGVNVRLASSAGAGSGGGGTTDFSKVSAGHAVASLATTGFDLTDYFNRGLMYRLEIEETGGVSTGTYDVRLYSKDTKLAADLLYSVDAIDSTADSRVYADQLPIYYRDDDGTDELHLQIDNNDAAKDMTFTVTIKAEVYETGIGGGGGDVVGPASAEDSNIALFDSTTGKLIKDGGRQLTDFADVVQPLMMNGGFDVWQRGTSFAAIAHMDRTAARWVFGQSAGSAVFTVSREEDAPTPQSRYSLKTLVTTANASPGATHESHLRYSFEGLNDIALMADRTITLSFYVKSNLTGTYSVALVKPNAAETTEETYLATYSVAVVDTWEKKTITIDLSTATDNTWRKGAGVFGLKLRFSYYAGTNFNGSAGWQAGNLIQVTGSNNLAATINNYHQLAEVKVQIGPVATPYHPQTYQETLMRCKRYEQAIGTKSGAVGFSGYAASGGENHYFSLTLPVEMCQVPSVTRGTSSLANCSFGTADPGLNSMRETVGSTATGRIAVFYTGIPAYFLDAEIDT